MYAETLPKINVKDIIEAVPTVDISDKMEFDRNGATYKNDHFEIEANEYYIIVDLFAEVSGNLDAGDYFNAPEFNQTNQSIDVSVKGVFLGDDEIELTNIEVKNLAKEIQNNIIL